MIHILSLYKGGGRHHIMNCLARISLNRRYIIYLYKLLLNVAPCFQFFTIISNVMSTLVHKSLQPVKIMRNFYK